MSRALQRTPSRYKSPRTPDLLRKVPTGIHGLDEITGGGLPAGRPTLVCGAAGCGKSLFGIEFLVRGASVFGEPGVLVTFEETADDIRKNASSLGFNLGSLIAANQLVIDHVHVVRAEIEENGDFDLAGLFLRIGHAIDRIGAKRVVLDTIEALFTGFTNQAILRSEVHRLFAWLKARGITTIVTAERGEGSLTRQGLEEYVSDCVILLDHRVLNQVTTRLLRVVKYRGSRHGTNEYPFLIDDDGISVLPLTSSKMDYAVTSERVTTGVPDLDVMLGGKGYFRGSTIMVSGPAGAGKSSFAAALADATCRNGERCVYFSFEESSPQILRNMRSIGLDLSRHVRAGRLQLHSTRPTVHGIEKHLVRMHRLVDTFRPQVVIIDPISNLAAAGTAMDSVHLVIRWIDFLRTRGITAFFVNLASGEEAFSPTEVGIRSMLDTWIEVRDLEYAAERSRAIFVRKSRGMGHSNEIREFTISDSGLRIAPAYRGDAAQLLTGRARVREEAGEQRAAERRTLDANRARSDLANRQASIREKISRLQRELDAHDGGAPREAGRRKSHTTSRR